MPEGDTLHKIADYMRPRMCGRTLVKAVLCQQPAVHLHNLCINHVEARGKHLVVHLAKDDRTMWLLRVHLGMGGAWHVYTDGEAYKKPFWQANVLLILDDQQNYVCFNAEDIECLRPEDVYRQGSRLGQLGPDLLNESPDFSAIMQRVAMCHSQTLIIDVLLNQRLAAGLGNVYKSELMFLHKLGIHTPMAALQACRLRQLFEHGAMYLRRNMGGWPRTLTYDRTKTRALAHLPRLWVYARKGQSCLLCRTPIVRAILGTSRRSTYWCPTCQPHLVNTTPLPAMTHKLASLA